MSGAAQKLDTIFALASAPGRAGIAVVRVSGDQARAAVETMTRAVLPADRTAGGRSFYRSEEDTPFDRGLVLAFKGPRSFTGEDVVECHLHGGPAVIAAILETLQALDGFRMAEPGEFTRRAFENGKLDLTQAEGIADLVNAETEAQRKQALRQMDGELGVLYERWRKTLLESLAHLEAWLDFPDEELEGAEAEAADVIRTWIAPDVLALNREVAAHLAAGRKGEIIRNGFKVAILGAPNVGKSTLLNSLAMRDVAITSETAGTTRDVIEVHLDLGGIPVVLSDTAGLREAENEIEAEGVRRAERAGEDADLKLVMTSAEDWPELASAVMAQLDESSLLVVSKIDLTPERSFAPGEVSLGHLHMLSAKTGEGLDDLTRAISERAANALDWPSEPFLTRHRHRAALEEVTASLTRFEEGCGIGQDLEGQNAPELLAEDLRLAARSVGRITGRVDVEDILDIVFAEFCIGK